MGGMTYDVTIPSSGVLDAMLEKLRSLGVSHPGLVVLDGNDSFRIKVSTKPSLKQPVTSSIISDPIKKERVVSHQVPGSDDNMRNVYKHVSVLKDEVLEKVAAGLKKAA